MSNTTPLFTTLADPSNDTNPESPFFGISILPINVDGRDWSKWTEAQRAVYNVRLQNYTIHRIMVESRFDLDVQLARCTKVRDCFAAIYLATRKSA